MDLSIECRTFTSFDQLFSESSKTYLFVGCEARPAYALADVRERGGLVDSRGIRVISICFKLTMTTMASPGPPSHQLPPEILEQCLRHLGPPGSREAIQTLARCRAASRDLRQLASHNTLWAPHLAQWHHQGHIQLENAQSSTLAMDTFRYRWLADQSALAAVDSIVFSPTSRCEKFDVLDGIGLNAWDVLSEEYQRVGDLEAWQRLEMQEGPYWLTKRHWLRECLGFLARREAMALLARIASESSQVTFEEALMLFSSFLGADRALLKQKLDVLAEDCRIRLEETLKRRDLRAAVQGIRTFMDDVGSKRLSSCIRIQKAELILTPPCSGRGFAKLVP